MHLQQMLNSLKSALRLEQRPTLQESYELPLLAETIVEYGRMIHAYERLSTPEVIVEVAEIERGSEKRSGTLEMRSCC
jgi:hypothetical protein